MGYDDAVPSFIHQIFNKDVNAYVLILTASKASFINEQLQRSFNKDQMMHIIINYGHRTTCDSYQDIHLESAEQIFIVGRRSLPTHDAINVECVDSICRYLEQKNNNQRPKRITCVFKDLDTYAAFKTSEIFGKVNKLGIEFVPYNYHTGWAKQVFIKRFYVDLDGHISRHDYPAVYGNGISPDDNKYVHLVFVGTTNFAVAFAMEAAHVLHFPNFNHNKDLKTRISFIDLNADKEKDEFMTRNRHFFEVQPYIYQDLSENSVDDSEKVCHPSYFKSSNFLDIEFHFIKGNIFSQRVQEEICKWSKDKDHQYLSIFLAMENQHSNFVMGMNMPDEVYDNEIPIFIRQDRSDNFVTNLREVDSKEFNYYRFNDKEELISKSRTARYGHLYPFGMNETAFCYDDKSLKRAKLINYLYCTADYSTYKFPGLLELATIPNQEIWERAEKMWRDENFSVANKWSNLYSSYSIRTKLATLRAMRGLTLDDKSKDTQPLTDIEVEELAMVEHNRWNVEKLLMGFRKARDYEDAFKATDEEDATKLVNNKKLFIHHDIRPFDELDEIKELDREFSRYIPWIMEMTES
jgi:hypothetical protein